MESLLPSRVVYCRNRPGSKRPAGLPWGSQRQLSVEPSGRDGIQAQAIRRIRYLGPISAGYHSDLRNIGFENRKIVIDFPLESRENLTPLFGRRNCRETIEGQ